MKSRSQAELLKEIEDGFVKNVTGDARNTILTIRNLIESNSRVEESIDGLHKSITDANSQSDKLQKRIYLLTIAAVVLTMAQVFAVLVELFKR